MIDKKTLEKSAMLSRLHLNDEEQEVMLEQMRRIIKHFDKLQAVETDGVEPLYTAVDIENVWRADVKTKLNDTDELLSKAPDVQEGQVKVPQVVK